MEGEICEVSYDGNYLTFVVETDEGRFAQEFQGVDAVKFMEDAGVRSAEELEGRKARFHGLPPTLWCRELMNWRLEVL